MNEFEFALIILAELVMVLFIIWGIFNERKLIRFERNLWRIISRFFRDSFRRVVK